MQSNKGYKKGIEFMEQLNLTKELSQLLIYVGNVAIAIRMNSAYNGDSIHNPNTPYDVMWLSDSLHNFDVLGEAIEQGNPEKIDRACGKILFLINNQYTKILPEFVGQLKGNPPETFERYNRYVDLNKAAEILNRIREKVSSLIKAKYTCIACGYVSMNEFLGQCPMCGGKIPNHD